MDSSHLLQIHFLKKVTGGEAPYVKKIFESGLKIFALHDVAIYILTFFFLFNAIFQNFDNIKFFC